MIFFRFVGILVDTDMAKTLQGFVTVTTLFFTGMGRTIDFKEVYMS